MHIKRVVIENFQSHNYTEIELNPGLNVLVGESDRGKSAVIRALRWLFYNEPRGTDYIRVGNSQCRVAAELENGISVTRERSANKNRYIVDDLSGSPQVYEGFGHEVPLEVAKLLGVLKIHLDDDLSVSLNVSGQLESPFLLSASGSLKAKAIGRLYDVHIIDAALRDTTHDIVELQKRDNNLQLDLQELDDRLKGFDDLGEMESRLKKLHCLLNGLDSLRNHLTRLKGLSESYNSIQKEKDAALNIIESVKTVDSAFDLLKRSQRKLDRFNRLNGLSQKWRECIRLSSYNKKIIEATRDIKVIEKDFTAVNTLTARLGTVLKLKKKRGAVGEQLRKTNDIMLRTTEVSAAGALLEELNKRYDYFCKLDKLSGRIKDLRDRQKKGGVFLMEREKELQQGAQEYRRVLVKIGKCPVCFGPVDDRTIDRILKEYGGK